MSKGQDQPILTFWSAVIGVAGVIIGALFGYFGTKANAEAQIRVAEENANAQITAVWIPIQATQTAEAKFIPEISTDQSNVVSVGSSGIPIPISNIQVDGKIIGTSFKDLSLELAKTAQMLC